jgi:hypothetical protein
LYPYFPYLGCFFIASGQKFDAGICVLNKHIPVQMSSSPAQFSMVMIRNLTSSEDTPSKDDRLSISRDGQYFNVTYTNKPEGVKQTVSLTANDVYKYLKNTITLLSNDDEPFSHIQFNFPAIPAVMYKTSNINMVYDVVLEQIDNMIANWPINA